MLKALLYLLSIPKTIYVNFRTLPLAQAIKLPIAVSYDTDVQLRGGKIQFESGTKIRTGMVRLGFLYLNACDTNAKTRLFVKDKGILTFGGEAHMGHGSRIVVRPGADLFLGDNFAISQNTTIQCYKKITFGKDIQFSWDCLVMDSDTHTVLNEDGTPKELEKEIVVGDKVWIGCRCTILKGTVIPSNTVIGACSFVSGKQFEENTLIVGHPAKSTRKIGGWHL